MSTITKEQVHAISDLKAGYTLGHADVAILQQLARIALASLEAEAALVMPAELHPDTRKLVTDFCTALAEKLYKAQLKYGYDADWKQDGWPTQCQAHFHQHIAKGDPRDVAAYCAFMWYHGWKTEAAPPAPVSVPDERAAFNAWNNDNDCPLAGRDAKTAAWLAWSHRAAMLQCADQPQSAHQNIPENIPATQFKPVADLYGLTSPTGGETLFTFDAVEARDFIDGGWSCQEYVELGRYQEAVSGNSPVIPDGWVMVPVEPTEHMIVEGFESEPDEFFSDEEVWEAYDAMSGCQQAAHRAKLCWAAMIAAAPWRDL